MWQERDEGPPSRASCRGITSPPPDSGLNACWDSGGSRGHGGQAGRDGPCGTRAVSLATLVTQMLECMLAGASKGGGQTRGSWGHRGTGGLSPDPISAEAPPTASASGGVAGGAGSGPDSLPEPRSHCRGHAWSLENGHTGAVTHPGANSWGREGAPTRPRGGRALQGLSWHLGCACAPSGLLGPFAVLQEASACRGPGLRLPATYGCTNQVVRRPPQRGRSSGRALGLLCCPLLRPVAQDGGEGAQGQRLEGPGPHREPQARPMRDQEGPGGFGSESSCPDSQVKP